MTDLVDKKDMRIGITSSFYPIPPEVAEENRWEWQMKKMAELGCRAFQMGPFVDDGNETQINRISELSKSLDMELEVPSIFKLFSWDETNAQEIKQAFISRIKTMNRLNTKIMRMGYGRLNIETSRYNKQNPPKQQMAHIVNCLKEAAKIVEEYDVYLALENHCDFKAEEMAEIFDAVGSSHVGCAFDTANGYTTFTDPNDDAKFLVPHTITTHIKDMVILKDPVPGRTPFYAQGCALGEGHVDVPMIIDLLSKKAPFPVGSHLIIELGWMPVDQAWDKERKDAYMADNFHKSIAYLLELIK